MYFFQQYGGHIFWDQETWMYPTILALHSNLGKTLVGTRIRTLDSAYLYATQRGYKGAMYPWESAFVGKFIDTYQGLDLRQCKYSAISL